MNYIYLFVSENRCANSSMQFIADLEPVLGRRLAKRPPGRKARAQDDKQTLLLQAPLHPPEM
jgi:hypothetical protein